MALSKEDEERFLEEYQEIIAWSLAEEKKITRRLKAEGRYLPGLDGINESYKPVGDKAKRKISELRLKYGIE